MISIVTTTFNRSVQMYRGLRSILRQGYKDMEIVIVDDGSTDDTEDKIAELRVNYPLIHFTHIYLDHPEHRISSIPRNVGFKAAKGDIVLFTESELIHVDNSIEQMLQVMEENPDRTPVCTQMWTMGKRIWEKLSDETFEYPRRLIEHPYAMLVSGNMQNTKAPDSDFGITGSKNCFTGAFFGVKKQWVLDIGGFDESFEGHGWDDWDLLHRLNLYGKGILYCNDIAVVHQWHEKNYPYNTIDAGTRNGKISEERIKRGEYRANIGKDWGII